MNYFSKRDSNSQSTAHVNNNFADSVLAQARKLLRERLRERRVGARHNHMSVRKSFTRNYSRAGGVGQRSRLVQQNGNTRVDQYQYDNGIGGISQNLINGGLSFSESSSEDSAVPAPRSLTDRLAYATRRPTPQMTHATIRGDMNALLIGEKTAAGHSLNIVNSQGQLQSQVGQIVGGDGGSGRRPRRCGLVNSSTKKKLYQNQTKNQASAGSNLSRHQVNGKLSA